MKLTALLDNEDQSEWYVIDIKSVYMIKLNSIFRIAPFSKRLL